VSSTRKDLLAPFSKEIESSQGEGKTAQLLRLGGRRKKYVGDKSGEEGQAKSRSWSGDKKRFENEDESFDGRNEKGRAPSVL